MAGRGRPGVAGRPLPPVKRETLGRIAAVLLPLEKLKLHSPRGPLFEEEVHHFLLTTFNGYTVASGNISGHWKDNAGRDHYGEHREYQVALAGSESGQSLEVFLAGLAAEMQEECIYLQSGAEIFLIYRDRP